MKKNIVFLLYISNILSENTTHHLFDHLLQDDLYLCSTRQPVSTRKPLDSGYQEEDYRYLYKIPWSHLTGGGGSVQQQSNTRNQR